MQIDDRVEYVNYVSISNLTCKSCIYFNNCRDICDFNSSCRHGEWLIISDSSEGASCYNYSQSLDLLYNYYRRSILPREFIMKLVKLVKQE